MNFKPLGNRVLVKAQEPETKTASGIIIPDNASKDKPTQAKIVAIGDGIKTISLDDTVVFEQYSGNGLTLDGVEYLILDEKDILGVIK